MSKKINPNQYFKNLADIFVSAKQSQLNGETIDYSKLSVEFFDYYESFDTGFSFDSIINKRASQLIKERFFYALKQKINQKFSDVKQFSASALKASTVFCKDEDCFIKINLQSNKIHLNEYLPSIEINSNGMVYAKIENINSYGQDAVYSPHSLYFARNKYSTVDDLPLGIKMLELSIKHYLSQVRYNGEKNLFEIDDEVFYCGLSKNNLISKYADYLNDHFFKFCEAGVPSGYKLFPKEIEDALNELMAKSVYGANRQTFKCQSEEGEVQIKRPSEFFRDLQWVIEVLASLDCDSLDYEDEKAMQNLYLQRIFDILSQLFANDKDAYSAQKSMDEYVSLVENVGKMPISAIADVLEGYWCVQNAFSVASYALKVIYYLIDEIKKEFGKKSKFIVRQNTLEKGLSFEEYAIVVHEKVDKAGEVSFVNRYNGVCNLVAQNCFSVLMLGDKAFSLLKENKKTDRFNKVTKLDNLFVHNFYEQAENFKWNNDFYTAFKFHSLMVAIDNSYDDINFEMLQLVNTQAVLQEERSKYDTFISENDSYNVGYNLMYESVFVTERISIKKQIREEYDRDKQKRHDKIFNFAFAVFGAFGVASSIVDILISDPFGQTVSIGSMLLYLLVVLLSYKNSKK